MLFSNNKKFNILNATTVFIFVLFFMLFTQPTFAPLHLSPKNIIFGGQLVSLDIDYIVDPDSTAQYVGGNGDGWFVADGGIIQVPALTITTYGWNQLYDGTQQYAGGTGAGWAVGTSSSTNFADVNPNNIAPTGTFNSATQNTDGAGNVAASITVSDADANNSKAKIEYSTSSTCASGLTKATLLTDASMVTATVNPEPVVDQTNVYQIGPTTPILTSSANTVTFKWDSKTDLPLATGGTNYYLCLTANDGTVDQTSIGASSAIAVDNTAPTNQDTVFPTSAYVVGGATVIIVSSGDITNNVWFAPSGTTTFSAGVTMTTAGGTATTILAPATAGDYRMFIIDAKGNVSTQSTVILTVDNTAPATTDNSDTSWHATNQTITLTPTDAGGSGVAWTKYCQDTDNTCTVSSGTAYTVPVIVSTEGTSYFRYASQDNAGNTQTTISKTVKVDTTAPTTYSTAVSGQASYTFNTWTNANVTVSLVNCSDGSGAGCSATFYCTDTANTCTPTTAYTVPVVISTNGTSYIRYSSTDLVSNSETTKSQTLKIDTTAPTLAEVTNVAASTSDTTPDYTFSSTEAGTITYGGSCSSSTTTAVVGNNTITFNALTAGTYSDCTITVTDSLTNASTPLSISSFTVNLGGGGAPSGSANQPTGPFAISINNGANSTASREVVLNLTAGPDTVRMALSNNPEFANAVQETYSTTKTWTMSDGQGQKTVYAKFYTSYGVSSGVVFDNIVYSENSPEPSGIALEVKKITNQIANIGKQISGLFGGQVQPEFTIPEKTPIAFQKLEIMSVNPLSKFTYSPARTDIGFFMDKLPQLKKVLDELAININNASDVKKLSQVKLSLPGLTQTILNTNQNAVPLADLSAKALSRIPTNIIFAKALGGLIDFNSIFAVDLKGNVKQIIRVVSGKPIELVIKPESSASSVVGLVVLKKAQSTTGSIEKNQNSFMKLFSAALSLVTPQSEKKDPASGDLLVHKFEYKETKPGAFTAEINAPTVEGEYEINTIVSYKDQSIGSTETKITALVDPEGYVYNQMSDGRLRIEKAVVSIYWLNPSAGSGQAPKYELWPADKFMQKNPMTTDNTGRYYFLVPQGTYYLSALANGYKDYKGEIFSVAESNAVNVDIEMQKKTILPIWLNWEAIAIILLIFAVLFCVFILWKKRIF